MGTNSPYFPNNVLSDEEAIVYLGMMVSALKTQTYLTKTGAGPFTLTGTEMVGTVVEFSGATAAVTVNTATASQIVAAMQAADANAGVGSTTQFAIVNDNTSSGAITVVAGTGVTLVGPGTLESAVAITTVRRWQIKILTLTTVSMTVIG
jgi:hypothetical protein